VDRVVGYAVRAAVVVHLDVAKPEGGGKLLGGCDVLTANYDDAVRVGDDMARLKSMYLALRRLFADALAE
jgi:hypothetical protein